MGICSEFVELLKREKLTSISIKRERDSYRLALNLLRRFEAMMRMGYNPQEDRGKDSIKKAIEAEIARLYANKRMRNPLNNKELSRVAEACLGKISSMDCITREICALYYQLMATGRRHLIELISI